MLIRRVYLVTHGTGSDTWHRLLSDARRFFFFSFSIIALFLTGRLLPSSPLPPFVQFIPSRAVADIESIANNIGTLSRP